MRETVGLDAPKTAESEIPGFVRTLLEARAGEWLLVRCVLFHRHASGVECLTPQLVVQVRDVGPWGVIVALPDGTDRRIEPDCAALVHVETPSETGLVASGPAV